MIHHFYKSIFATQREHNIGKKHLRILIKGLQREIIDYYSYFVPKG
jgi:hypothetical protein